MFVELLSRRLEKLCFLRSCWVSDQAHFNPNGKNTGQSSGAGFSPQADLVLQAGTRQLGAFAQVVWTQCSDGIDPPFFHDKDGSTASIAREEQLKVLNMFCRQYGRKLELRWSFVLTEWSCTSSCRSARMTCETHGEAPLDALGDSRRVDALDLGARTLRFDAYNSKGTSREAGLQRESWKSAGLKDDHQDREAAMASCRIIASTCVGCQGDFRAGEAVSYTKRCSLWTDHLSGKWLVIYVPFKRKIVSIKLGIYCLTILGWPQQTSNGLLTVRGPGIVYTSGCLVVQPLCSVTSK